ncbi:hypothetical protein ACFVW1_15625 [Streptomyces olivochromogenes]|uniref:hypothetical protein n=1 Tax=Streptomyces olivochromogenes TaxID=1963 RepID=UPI0036D9C303
MKAAFDDIRRVRCWGRYRDAAELMRDWHQAGVWQALHQLLLAELRTGQLDFSRAAADGSHLRAMKGGANDYDTYRRDLHRVPRAPRMPYKVIISS